MSFTFVCRSRPILPNQSVILVGKPGVFRKLGHLVTVLKELKRNRSAIQSPDAAAPGHNAGLGGGLYTGIVVTRQADSSGEDLVNHAFIDANKVSTATSAKIIPELT